MAICILLVATAPVLGAEAGAAGTAGEAPPDPTAIIEEQLRAVGASDLESYFDRLDRQAQDLLAKPRLSEFLPGAKGQDYRPQAFLSAIARYLFREVVANARLLSQLLVLAVLTAVLQALQGGFGEKSFGDAVFAICYLVLVLIGIQTFRAAIAVGRGAIDNMVAFMQALVPMLTSLLLAAGAVTSAALMSPLMYAVLTTLADIINALVLPLVFFAAVLGLAGNISEKLPLTRLAASARQAAVGVLGLSFSAFLGVMIVRGVTAPVADGVSIRAGKFLASNFIPVIGKMFSDAVEIVAGSSLLAKNAIGLLGIFVVVALCTFPALKVLALVIVYRITGALIQPVSDKRLVDALGQLESSLMLVVVVVGAVGVMFFIALTILIGVGNLSLAVR